MTEGWVRVEDEMPEYFALLLIVIDNSPGHSASIGVYHNERWFELELWKRNGMDVPMVALKPNNRVTHWQPLPFAPSLFG